MAVEIPPLFFLYIISLFLKTYIIYKIKKNKKGFENPLFFINSILIITLVNPSLRHSWDNSLVL